MEGAELENFNLISSSWFLKIQGRVVRSWVKITQG